jgi:hypothetical protein
MGRGLPPLAEGWEGPTPKILKNKKIKMSNPAFWLYICAKLLLIK